MQLDFSLAVDLPLDLKQRQIVVQIHYIALLIDRHFYLL